MKILNKSVEIESRSKSNYAERREIKLKTFQDYPVNAEAMKTGYLKLLNSVLSSED